jgi:CYTH domain-containing protein
MSAQSAVDKTGEVTKFRLPTLPSVATTTTPSLISQIYLDIENSEAIKRVDAIFGTYMIDWKNVEEIRVRAETQPGDTYDKYTIVIKDYRRYRDLVVEVNVAQYGLTTFEDLCAVRQNLLVEKLRYRIPISGSSLVAEIDSYLGDLSGLVIAEIEFDPAKPCKSNIQQDLKMALQLLGPDAVNVTSNNAFKNRELAKLSSVPA